MATLREIRNMAQTAAQLQADLTQWVIEGADSDDPEVIKGLSIVNRCASTVDLVAMNLSAVAEQ